MAKKEKKNELIEKHLKGRSKNKYTIRQPTFYKNYRESVRNPTKSPRELSDMMLRQRRNAGMKGSEGERLSEAIAAFSPGEVRAAQMRAGIKSAFKDRELNEVLGQLLNPRMTITEKKSEDAPSKPKAPKKPDPVKNPYRNKADNMMKKIDEQLATPVADITPEAPKTIYDRATSTEPKELQIGAAERTKKMGTETFKRRKTRSASQRRASLRINKTLNL